MHRFRNLIINPFIIAFIITIVIVIFLPPLFNKYKLEIVHQQLSDRSVEYYAGVTGDSITELIRIGYEDFDTKSFPFLMIRDKIGFNNYGGYFIEQFNLKRPWICNAPLIVHDFDLDKQKEIFLFTAANDSLFLTQVSPYKTKNKIQDYFIAKVSFRNNQPDFKIFEGGFFDFDRDNSKELLFTVSAGFSLKPRNIYIYDLNDTVLKASNTANAAFYFPPKAVKLSSGEFRISSACYSPFNPKEGDGGLYPDSCSWFMLFDQDLNHVFPPKKFAVTAGFVYPAFLTSGGSVHIGVVHQAHKSGHHDSLIIYDMKGKAINKQFFETGQHPHFIRNILDTTGINILVDGSIIRYDKHLNIIRTYKTNYFNILMTADIDKDGENENICRNLEKSSILVYDHNFKNPASVAFPYLTQNIFISATSFGDEIANLCVDSGDKTVFYKYARNPLYYLRIPLYLSIYIVLSLFFYVLLKIQRENLNRKFEQQQKMLRLELMTIRNQIDPHFTFNAINTISSFVMKGEKQKTHDFLTNFSKLIRNALLNSRKISIVLKDEL